MSDFGGSDANLEVGITADTKGAEEAIERAIGKAFAQALKSPEVKAAIAGMVKQFNPIGENLGKKINTAFDQMLAASKRVTTSMVREFDKVGNAAKDAFDFRTASGKGPPELRTLNAAIEATTRTMDKLELSTKDTLRALETMTRQASAATRAAAQADRDATNLVTQAQRATIGEQQLEAARIRRSGNISVALIRAASRQMALAMRGVGAAIEGTFRTASRVVRSFTSSASRLLGGFSRSASSSFAAIGRGLATAFRGALGIVQGFTRTATRLISTFARGGANAFKGLFSGFRALLSRQERDLQGSLNRQSRAVRNAQSGLSGGVLGRAALAGGAGVGLASFLGGGLERFSNIETLQFRFERLLGSAGEAQALLERLSDFARTTSFDLPGVAGLASNFLAMGQSADETVLNIQRLADVTAFAGGNTDSLERIQRALGQIISTGKLQGDELNQLAENLPGINIRQIIADQLGITTSELVKMQEDGKLSADAFITAFLEGIDDPRYQGAAVEIAGTLTGRLANLKESFDIFAATIIGAVSGPLGSAMTRITNFLTGIGGFISGDILQPETGGEDDSRFGARFTKPLTDMQENLILLREVLGNVAKAVAGLVALKGVFELFSLGARGARLLLTPMGLLSVTVIGITAAFTLFNRISTKFADSFKAMTARVKPAFDAIIRLGRAIRDALIEPGEGEGGPGGILLKIADGFSVVTDAVGRVLHGVQRFADEMAGIIEVVGFDGFFGVGGTLDRSFAGLAAGIFGFDKPEWQAARDRGGSEFLNILEMTFLRPVVQFFRGPFLRVATTIINGIRSFIGRIASAIGGFFSDLFDGIFGGSDAESGPGGFFRSVEEQMAPGEGVGSRLLDNLENTFLGPVVRFFRGPFADAIESVGGFIGGLFNAIFRPAEGAEDDSIITRVADFLEENGPFRSIVTFLREGGLQQAYNNVRDFFAPTFESIGDAISGAWDKIGPIVKPLIDAITDVINAFKEWDFSKMDLGNVAMGAGIGGGLGLLLGGLPGLILGAVGGALSQTGIFGGIVDTINNAWTMAIQPALSDLWGKIQSFITNTFSGENLGKASFFILDTLYAAGELVGNIATDPRFVGAIAGVAAAGVLVVGQFTLGLIAGLAASLVEWANLISDALESAWLAIAPEFIPDPIVRAIADVLGSPALGLIAGAGAAALGTVIVRSVIGGISNFGPALVQGAGGLVGMIFGKQKLGADGLPAKAKSAFGSVGNAVAGAVIGGIVSFEVGRATGEEGGVGNLVLGLLTGATTGAVLGTAIAPGFGTALGAILGAGAAALGSYFGTAERKAREARGEVEQYVEALRGINTRDYATEGGNIVRLELEDQSAELQDFFITAGFDFDAFAQGIIDGNGDINESFSTLLEGLTSSRAFENLSPAQQEGLRQYIDEYRTALENGLSAPYPDSLAGRALETLGIDTDTLAVAFQFLTGETSNFDEALAELGRSKALSGISADLNTVDGAVTNFLRTIESGLPAGSFWRFLDQTAAGTEGGVESRLAILEGVIDGLKEKIDETRQSLVDLISGELPSTPEEIRRDFRIDLPNLEQQLNDAVGEEGLSVSLRADIEDQNLDEIEQQIRDGIAQGIADGTIDSEADFSSLLGGLRDDLAAAVADGTISQEFADEISGILDDVEFGPGVADAFNRLARDQSVLDAATGAGNAILDALQDVLSPEQISVIPQEFLGGFTSGGTTTGLDLSSLIDVSGFETKATDASEAFQTAFEGEESAISSSVGDTVSKAVRSKPVVKAVQTAGGEVADATATGISANQQAALAAGIQLGYSAAGGTAVALPRMYAAGANLSRAMAQGIRDQAAAAALAAAAVAYAVANAARSALRIASPSQVFVDIGRQIGEGFVEGIEDSETTMADALSKAISNAIDKATDAASQAMRDAQAGSAIFGALAPSTLPGGTTTAAITQQRLSLSQNISSFASDLRSGAGGLFGDILGSVDVAEARAQVQGLGLDLNLAFAGVRADYNEAIAAQRALAEFDAERANIVRQFNSGALGAARRQELLTEANQDYREQQEQLADSIARLQVQFNLGKITIDDFNSRVAEMNAEFQAIEAVEYQEAIAQINADFRSGTLNAQEYRERLDELGSRPAALTFEQRSLIASGAASLNLSTVAGQANREAIAGALGDIRNFGQTLLEAGVPIPEVIRQLQVYTANIRRQAIAAGFNAAQLDGIIQAYGLTNAQLEQFRQTILSLNPATVTGAQNVAEILTQLQGIRDFGQSLLDSGTAASSAVEQMRAYRQQLIAQAVAFGFSATEIAKLVEQVGLSDAALAEFLRQMQEFADAANGANAPGGGMAPIEQPVINQTVNVVVPHGDPEAVGLAVANRMAYDMVRL